MIRSSKAKVKLDLTPIKKGVEECDSYIELNSLDQPETITISIKGLDSDQINFFCKGSLVVNEVFGNDNFSGISEAGDAFSGQLSFIKGVSFWPAEARLECYLGNISQGAPEASKANGRWVFGLANYRICGGDAWTDVLPPKDQLTPEKIEELKASLRDYHIKVEGIEYTKEQIDSKYKDFKTTSGGKRRNRIQFMFAGREWTLDDDMHGRWPKEVTKISEPVRSGVLSTEQRDGEDQLALHQAADDIGDLLSLALGRDIKWVMFGRQGEGGSVQALEYRKPGLLAFNQNRSALADNWEPCNLQRFVEVGEKPLIGDRDWWSVTIGLLTQVGATKYLMVKCSLLNTLLDRITSRVNGEVKNPEIDAGLEAKLDNDAFRVTLHYILSSLTNKWERHPGL